MSEHDRFGLQRSNAPTEDPEAVDDGGVSVGADQRVREGNALAVAVLEAGRSSIARTQICILLF